MRYRYGKNIPFLLFPAVIICHFSLKTAFLIRKIPSFHQGSWEPGSPFPVVVSAQESSAVILFLPE